MENEEIEEFEIALISQSVKRLFYLGLSYNEILEKIADGISETISELTAEELYENARMRSYRGLEKWDIITE